MYMYVYMVELKGHEVGRHPSQTYIYIHIYMVIYIHTYTYMYVYIYIHHNTALSYANVTQSRSGKICTSESSAWTFEGLHRYG